MPIATDIDPALLERAREATGIEDTRELLNEGPRLLVTLRRQESILELRGAIGWEGDLQRVAARPGLRRCWLTAQSGLICFVSARRPRPGRAA